MGEQKQKNIMSLNRDIQVVFEDLENEMEDARKNFFEDDGFFSENSILKSSQSLLNKDVSLFNSNNRGTEESSFEAFPSAMRDARSSHVGAVGQGRVQLERRDALAENYRTQCRNVVLEREH